ncbi:MAG: glycosyltransferase family 39 protein, partial [Rhizobiales bacterium]|nr:glycosyltransferase family 39 protein [Hyphomicrobiales bacterium]
TALGVRAFSVLAAAITSYAIFATARNLGFGMATSARSALWLNATILIGAGAILVTPDSPSVLFWALAVWVMADIRRIGEGWLWLLVGLFAGLGCLSKYTNLFLGVGAVLWLLLDRDARRWFLSPWLWAGGLVAVLTFLPVLLWNAEHDWISFHKQFGRISDGGLQPRYVGELLAAQFGLLNPLIAVFAGLGAWLAACALFVRRGGGEGALAFLFLLCLPLVAYMLVHALHARVQGNWLAPVYPALAALAAVAAAGVASRWLKGVARLAAPVGIGVSVLVLLFFMAPLPTPFGQKTPAERFVGWSDLAAGIEERMAATGATWIATADYGLTGELAFYGPGAERVQQVDERERFLFDHVAPGTTDGPAILVLVEQRARLGKFRRCFASLDSLGSIERMGPDGPVATYRLWRAEGAAPDILTRGCT